MYVYTVKYYYIYLEVYVRIYIYIYIHYSIYSQLFRSESVCRPIVFRASVS